LTLPPQAKCAIYYFFGTPGYPDGKENVTIIQFGGVPKHFFYFRNDGKN